MYLCSGTKKTTFTKQNHSWTSDLEMHAWKRRFHLQRNHVQYQFCFLYKAMWSFLIFFFIKLFSDIQLNSKLNWSTHFFFWNNFNTKAIALYLGLGFDQLPHRKLAAVPEWCPLISAAPSAARFPPGVHGSVCRSDSRSLWLLSWWPWLCQLFKWYLEFKLL